MSNENYLFRGMKKTNSKDQNVKEALLKMKSQNREGKETSRSDLYFDPISKKLTTTPSPYHETLSITNEESKVYGG